MNDQRKVIYLLRKDILNDETNRELKNEMKEDVSFQLAAINKPSDPKSPLNEWDWNNINLGFNNVFASKIELDIHECSNNHNSNLQEYINVKANEILEEKFSKYDKEQVTLTLREVLLSTFDQLWKDHLLNMDQLKEGINLRSYGQKDPLVEYKREAFSLYENMKEDIRRSVVEKLFSVRLYTQEEIEQIKKQQQQMLEAQLNAHKRAQEEAQRKNDQSAGPIQRKTVKVGRNDPCPCGSEKKFKHCHGA
jgi:preprotein translocase subunit SecA